jgi:hypothetical protein
MLASPRLYLDIFSQIYEYNPQSQSRLTCFWPMTNLTDASEETDISLKSFEILSKQKKVLTTLNKKFFFYFQDDRPDNGRALKKGATTFSTKDTHHNDNQHNKLLNIIILNVVMLSVALFHCYVWFIMLCVVMLSVVMLSVVMLSVVAP